MIYQKKKTTYPESFLKMDEIDGLVLMEGLVKWRSLTQKKIDHATWGKGGNRSIGDEYNKQNDEAKSETQVRKSNRYNGGRRRQHSTHGTKTRGDINKEDEKEKRSQVEWENDNH